LREIKRWVAGEPQPQGSMRMFRDKAGNTYLTSANPKLSDWRKAIAETFKETVTPPLPGATRVRLEFHLTKPPSVKRLLPWCKPDLDKLARACLDSLQSASVFKNDGQVVEIVATKVYTDQQSGVFITVEEIN
jgi:Holliday junction resolvase RusA-like endonuclease